MALAEAEFAGWLQQLLTHPVRGLENYGQLLETLTSAKDAIKVYCEVAPIDDRYSGQEAGAERAVSVASAPR